MQLPFVLTLIFFVALLVIAAWGMKRTNNINDFFLGGTTLGPWILAISYGTAYFSAVVFIGFSGQYGWLCSYKALWVGVLNAVGGGLLAWLVLGKRTRQMTRRLNAMTMPEFFSARYNTNGMKVVSALIIFIFLMPYSASVFAGLSYLFQNVFGIELWIALTVTTLFTGVYVVMGGYTAAARIDFLQGMIMFFGTLLMVWFVFAKFGGPEAAIARVNELYAQRTAMDSGELAIKPIPNIIFWSVVFMTSFAPWGLPQMVHKYYAIKDESQIMRGAIITLVFALMIGCAAYATGALSHLLPVEELDKAMVQVKGIATIDTNKLVPITLVYALPQWLLAIILLLVLSASMSTLSSLVLVSSSAVSIDLYKGYFAPDRSQKHYLWFMRVLSGLFILISYLIALFNPSWIVPLMSLSCGAVAGAFLSPYMYGLFWRGTTKMGAYAGMWTGLIVANGIYWGTFITWGAKYAKMYSPLAATFAIILPFFVVPVVSWMTRPVAPETVAKAFGDPDPNQEAA
ncbi:MAG: hypothetical protein PHQ75_02140 [Thermoguttaceae bacterium]|nr:hypothetical protein [Thermoguttaceae bacterium]